jgi:hydroxyethylthiazole kinase
MKQTINEGTANAAGYARLVDEVRRTKPLIQQLTNFVTVNDCANMTLAIGASPIMADAIEEAGEIAAIAGAVVLNMGAINARTVPAMIAAGKAANSAGVPVVFDPVGAGASTYRNVTAELFMREMQVDVLRGNISEVRFLAGHAAQTKGVDAADGDELHREDAMELARALAAARGCVVAITGKTDIVSDGKRVIAIENGHSMLACLTGTG